MGFSSLVYIRMFCMVSCILCYISSVIASVVILTPGLLDFNIVPVYGTSDCILFSVFHLLTISS